MGFPIEKKLWALALTPAHRRQRGYQHFVLFHVGVHGALVDTLDEEI